MYPASADFTFYGGLYRGVNLISVPGTHFDLDYFGGPGIKVTPSPPRTAVPPLRSRAGSPTAKRPIP